MRTRHALVVTFLALGSAASAGCNPFGGIEGDWTNGERGHTRWQTLDGLCPGLGGGCSFDVPIAVGARVTLAVDGIDGAPVTAAFSGAVESGGGVQVNEDSNTLVPVSVIGEGTGRVELSDTNGVLDAASVRGRVATVLECGRWPVGDDLEWRMNGLGVTNELTFPITSPSLQSADDFYLVCRAASSEGPMLSADAIDWTIVSGSESVQIVSTDFGTPGSSASGARIRYRGVAAGTAVVRASIGDVSTDLTITIE
ncbi:MAG: hypothetical protein J0L92_37420 [Deltaproteobacteria bacterium]|nr:hypothetical protein [Deltaproteobacteria bacterium]